MASSRPLPKILHVGATSGTPDRGAALPMAVALGEAMAAVLADGFETETCRDVYAALARLLKPNSPTADPVPIAVLVCVNDMEAAELEFFSLVARYLPELPTLVYGRSDLEGLISQAVDRGATGRATAEGLQALAERAGKPACEPSAATVENQNEPDAKEATDAQREASPSPDDMDGGPEADAAATDEPVEPVEPVRVPWLRYTSTPARRAPESPPTADDTTAIPEHTPLLTDEELQALMGPSDFDGANFDGANLDGTNDVNDDLHEDQERDDRTEFGQ